jgi:peptidoglycan/xylan/chitin deacetylase (PgdA/CDA1 family)
MYLDFSIRKLIALGAIVFVLVAFVFATHRMKMLTFGSTPYFYAIAVGSRYIMQAAVIEFGKLGDKMFASAAASLDSETQQPASTSAQESAPNIPVLTYHRVLERDDPNNVTVEVFADQMRTLKAAGWQTVTLQEFEEFIEGRRDLPKKSFLLTFDDGAKDSFYPVDPILRELDYHAAIFTIVQSSKTSESTYYLTPQETRLLLRTGRWSIGSHSYDGHRPYPVDTAGNTGIFFADRIWRQQDGRLETPEEFTARVTDDLSRARTELEATYEKPINTLAFPLGNETGIEGANNFPEGASITEAAARRIYDIGFVQLNDQTYTSNYPSTTTNAFAPRFPMTSGMLSTDFLAYRIHVDHDWDGKRLLSIMENGLAKPIPYEDDFTTDRGWIPSWGALDIGRNNLQLAAEPAITSASTFLDGTALWDDYSFDIAANWQRGYALVLADVLNSKTYHDCAFSPGNVRVQETINGVTRTLAEKNDPRIQYGENVSLGIRVHGSVIECAWNFESLIEAYDRNFSGGVGIQTWDPESGAARFQAISLIARPYADLATTTVTSTTP